MNKYKVELDSHRMQRLEVPLYMTYADGSEIDFSKEGIGVMVAIGLKKIPSFINDILTRRQYSANYSGVIAGEFAHIYVMETYTEIPLKEFYDICVQIAEKSIEAISVFKLRESGKIDDQWEEDIRSYIPRLKQLRDQYS